MAEVSIAWNSAALTQQVAGTMRRNLRLAGVYLQGRIRASINIGNPTGKFPSLPGEPPHKVSAQLFSSIAVSEPKVDGNRLTVYVGSNKVYARALELGFVGTTGGGHNMNLQARPFLRPGVNNNRPAILSLMLTGHL